MKSCSFITSVSLAQPFWSYVQSTILASSAKFQNDWGTEKWVIGKWPSVLWCIYPHPVMTSSNGNIFRVTGPLCGEFTGHRWIPLSHRSILLTKASDTEPWFFYLRMNKRLSKQSRRLWFETPSRSLWRHCNALALSYGVNNLEDCVQIWSVHKHSIGTIKLESVVSAQTNARHFAEDILNEFSGMKMFKFRLKFHWILFLIVEWTISQVVTWGPSQ